MGSVEEKKGVGLFPTPFSFGDELPVGRTRNACDKETWW